MSVTTNIFKLMSEHNFSLLEIENMQVWEKDIYIILLNHKIEEHNNAIKEMENR
tara:strand:- start:17 stop:178 length:162 start_codon:yes stop_codon:yes gene_type:complete